MKPAPMRSAMLAGACVLCLHGCANTGATNGSGGIDGSGLVNRNPFLDRMLAQSKALPEKCSLIWGPWAVVRVIANNCRP